jgi:uncharacterized protein YaiI (UPF0178 family)
MFMGEVDRAGKAGEAIRCRSSCRSSTAQPTSRLPAAFALTPTFELITGISAAGGEWMDGWTMPIEIFVDADACPVKEEIYRVAARYDLKVFIVANSAIRVPLLPSIERIVVGAGSDAADDWIAARARAGAIVVTSDIPLASRCVKAGAEVLSATGKRFTEASIGMALAARDLMDHLRSTGETTGGPKGFTPRDRSNFLSALDNCVVRLQRAGFA